MIRSFLFRFRYMSRPPWDSGVSPPELLAFLAKNPPGCALDLGCGTGTNVITMAHYGWQVTGIDFVPKAIRQARRKARKAGVDVDLILGDVTDPKKTAGEYDLVLDIGCYHSLTQYQRVSYRQNLSRILYPGGAYLLYGFTAHKQDERSGSLISGEDFTAFKCFLTLDKREDGFDHGGITSSWFWFKMKKGRSKPDG